jgi:hypothetical protein
MFYWSFHNKKKVYGGITDETQIFDEKLVDGMFSLGIVSSFWQCV